MEETKEIVWTVEDACKALKCDRRQLDIWRKEKLPFPSYKLGKGGRTSCLRFPVEQCLEWLRVNVWANK